MSITVIPCDLTLEQKKKALKDLVVDIRETKGTKDKVAQLKCLYFYDSEGNMSSYEFGNMSMTVFAQTYLDGNLRYSLPHYYASNLLKATNDLSDKKAHDLPFVGELRPEQKIIKEEAIKLLGKEGCCLLSLYTGCGKTIIALDLLSTLGEKTVVIVNRVLLLDQWEKSIKTCLPQAKTFRLTSKTKDIPQNVAVVLVSIPTLYKFTNNKLLQPFKTLIFDEVHTAMCITGLKCMHLLQPWFLIGLSASPEKKHTDVGKVLRLYFGDNYIRRDMHKDYKVFRVETGMTPTVEYLNIRGKSRVDWNHILDQQSINEKRNDLIVDIIRKHPDRCILVLCKRVKQVTSLYDKLKDQKEDVDKLVRSDRLFNTEARVLLSTYSKSGVGFDHPKLNTLIVASDVDELFCQYLGRIFRREDVQSVVFDLVDDYCVLRKHWQERLSYYRRTGGHVFEYCGNAPSEDEVPIKKKGLSWLKAGTKTK